MRAVFSLSLLLFAGCSSGPTTKVEKEPQKPPEPVSAQTAFFQMSGAARTWAPDVQGFQLQSLAVGGIAPQEGKYPAWRALFVSESRRSARSYTYSVVTADGLNQGIFSGPEESYSGPRGQNSAFPVQGLKVDSTTALETALKNGGADYARKNPKTPVLFVLENIKKYQNPTWRVVWGESILTSSFSVYVDAVTGEYLQTMH